MKTTKIIFFVFLIASMSMSFTGHASKNETTSVKKTDDVQVYYFHYARRCVTCKMVESESKKTIEELYGDKVSFAAYNLQDDKGEQKANELGISGQTLLIVSGETKINITFEGFMHAKNPEKYKQIIKDKIDPLMN